MPKRVRFDDMDSDFSSSDETSLIEKLSQYLEQHAQKLEDEDTLYTIDDIRFVLADIIGTLQLILKYLNHTPKILDTFLKGSLDLINKIKDNNKEPPKEKGHYFS